MPDKATFRASFPAIQSALKITGDGGGMRIQLDIPESDMGEAVKLLLMRQMSVLVTVEPELQVTPQSHEQQADGSRTLKRTAAKRRE